ncbi:MAG: glycosyl transferase family 2, partial [Rhodospirillales bacterium]|nr:glycosyl transferase family 2 [Rhodospirillales bacterium]
MMTSALFLIAAGSTAAWIYLLWGRGGFWRADQVLEDPAPIPESWPTVAAVIPARDEAGTVGRTVASLLAQDYPGGISVVVVDDN